jgi:zinc protease
MIADLRTILTDSASTTPEEMQDLAKRYLRPDTSWEVEVIPEKR